MGKTKVFMRRKAFEGLETLRNKKLESAATRIQAFSRMHLARIDYLVALYAIIVMQTFARRVGAYRMVRAYRIHVSAIRIQAAWRASQARAVLRTMLWSKVVGSSILLIQRVWRGSRARRIRNSAQWIAYWCQSFFRGARARQLCAFLFLDRKARVMQRAYAKHRSSLMFRKIRRVIITLQNRQRSRIARRELCRLRIEARDLFKVAAERDQYKTELEHLRKELEEVKKASPEKLKLERRAKAEEIEALRMEVDRLRIELEKAHRMTDTNGSQSEVQFLLNELVKREENLSQLKREVESLRSKDDSFSLSLRSFTIEASPSSGIPRPTITLVSQADSPVGKRGSPVRSDVSLLDVEDDARIPAPPYRSEKHESRSLDVSSMNSHFFHSEFKSTAGNDTLKRLHDTIRHGTIRQLDQILKTSNEVCLVINHGDKFGRTALHVAALALKAEVVEKLLSKGAVVNAQDDDGETPLHLAENPQVTELLLKKGRANPNIPNVDGICAIHLAVQRRDVDSVRLLLRHGADVNYADNIRWFTPLHLISLPARDEEDDNPEDDIRSRIAQLLCGSLGSEAPDLDYQDSQSNAPLHYAVQLESTEICNLLEVFLENGANPNICNERNQSPLHLLCHNGNLRNLGVFHDALRCMIHHGASPNLQSLTGCTPLHLTLYHKDVESAIQLVYAGADLHLKWKKVRTVRFLRDLYSPSLTLLCPKPSKWPIFWQDMGSSEVLALDMVESHDDLFRIISAITSPSTWAPPRSWCMNCRSTLGSFARALHCHHCRRLLCKACATTCLPSYYFPKDFGVQEPSWVCGICEKVLVGRKEETSNGTPPTAYSYGDDFPNASTHDEDGPVPSFGLDGPVASSIPNSSYGLETATSSYGFDAYEASSSSYEDVEGRSDLFAC